MPEKLNVYCDESCHLLNDRCPVMVLGAVWCPATAAREVSDKVKQAKAEHGVKPGAEVKARFRTVHFLRSGYHVDGACSRQKLQRKHDDRLP